MILTKQKEKKIEKKKFYLYIENIYKILGILYSIMENTNNSNVRKPRGRKPKNVTSNFTSSQQSFVQNNQISQPSSEYVDDLNGQIEEIYKQRTHHEQILKSPDTFIGSVSLDKQEMWIIEEDLTVNDKNENEEVNKTDIKIGKKNNLGDMDNLIMRYKLITFSPGLYKIYDEILVNARDHSVRDKTCRNIRVNIDEETGLISVWNDGNGIHVAIHKDVNKYVPEMIFGNLLTSSNYDVKKKTVGGKNGYGAKLANIYSKEFYVETIDAERRKKYYQKFTNNMYNIEPPIITDVSANTKPYTKISFIPDFERFNMTKLTPDIISLFKKRVYDLAACTNNNIYFNDKLIKFKSFENYIRLYYPNRTPPNLIYNEFSDRWKIGVVVDSNAGARQVSFVNGICTYLGGNHVKYILDQIADKILTHIKTKHKNLNVKPANVKENLTIFVDSVIEDPAFSSQTKEFLTTKIVEFGSECNITQQFINKIIKTNIIQTIVNLAEFKQNNDLAKTDYKKGTNVRSIEKLIDAHYAGTRRSSECSLLLTEGESAKSYAIAGLDIIGREKYGVFPLKGKFVNVREATTKTVSDNKEFTYLKQIIGLKQDMEYTEKDLNKLRYGGGVVLLTDQDSVCADTPLLLRKNGKIHIKTIETISPDFCQDRHLVKSKIKNNDINNDFNQNIKIIQGININKLDDNDINKLNQPGITIATEKEYGTTNYEVWTESGWTKIKKVMKHKVNKQIYRILTQSGVVDVTEDHSLLNIHGDKISPKDCKVNMELLHSFPIFEENIKKIPDNLNELSYRDIKNLASKNKIQYYQKYKKQQLIEKLLKIKNESQKLNQDTGISEEEAYVMGLFFSNGTSDIYYDKENDKTIYSWKITNKNKEYLDKSINIMEKKYRNNKFEIIKYETENIYELTICNSQETFPIVKKYRNLFYDKDKNKYIPPAILNANRIIRKNFFTGYFNGQKSHSFENQAEKIRINGKIGALGLYFLLKSLGHNISINHDINKPETYTLILRETQQNNSNKIKGIFKLGCQEQYVYDLETENHHFHAGIGSTIVSNTDGSHIKGLIINMFEYYWPSLLKINGFIKSLQTPIVKVWKKSNMKAKPLSFYTINSFKVWHKSINSALYFTKYYKGLGTSGKEDAREEFQNFNNSIIKYVYDNNTITFNNKPAHKSIVLAFAKTEADNRKEWLRDYNKDNILNHDEKNVTLTDYVNKDLIHFSMYSVYRSLPNIADGFKPSIRKIIYGCFKKKIDNHQIKVAQLGAYIAEQTAYHHGENSLFEAIIKMAQIFVGSNNINLLMDIGNFGYRRENGNDAASPRYIFTQLNKLTPLIFRREDEPLYTYVDEDGESAEPHKYAPIIPFILVNGTDGIGTGFSTKIPPFNPIDIVNNIKALINDQPLNPMSPWYRGYKGKIEQIENNKYIMNGVYEIINDSTLRITEIPIKHSIESYKEFLNTLVIDNNGVKIELPDKKNKKKDKIEKAKDIKKETKRKEEAILESFVDNSGLDKVDFTLNFTGLELLTLIQNGDLMKKLKLTMPITMTNMYLYSSKDVITKYNSIEEIILEFYNYRLNLYKLRKEHYLRIMEAELFLIKEKIRFIRLVLSEDKNKRIVINKRKESDIISDIVKHGFVKLSRSSGTEPSYDYITSLKMFAVTEDKIRELEDLYKRKSDELDIYRNLTIKEIWLNELDEFLLAYNTWLAEVNSRDDNNNDNKNNNNNIVKKNQRKPRTTNPKPRTTRKTRKVVENNNNYQEEDQINNNLDTNQTFQQDNLQQDNFDMNQIFQQDYQINNNYQQDYQFNNNYQQNYQFNDNYQQDYQFNNNYQQDYQFNNNFNINQIIHQDNFNNNFSDYDNSQNQYSIQNNKVLTTQNKPTQIKKSRR